MINNVVLVGRITADPVVRVSQAGKYVTSFNLAVDRRFKKEGDESADFIRCTAFEHSAKFIQDYVKKGTLLGIEGRIQTGSYDDAQGKKVYTTDIICSSVQSLQKIEKKETEADRYNDEGKPESDSDTDSDFNMGPLLDISSDDLPF